MIGIFIYFRHKSPYISYNNFKLGLMMMSKRKKLCIHNWKDISKIAELFYPFYKKLKKEDIF